MLDINEKFKLYRELIKGQQQAEIGFIEFVECDSLLFSSLIGCIPGIEVDIGAAFEEKTGRWLRKPKWFGLCYNPDLEPNKRPFWYRAKLAWKFYRAGQSKDALTYLLGAGSTISRDMLLGLAYYAWYNKRLDISESVINYALSHWGFMGEGDLSRINIMPSLFATYCWISYKLGGPSRAWARWIPNDFGAKTQGFQAHLQVLHILLRKDLTGKISEKDEKILKYHWKREPYNPLFRIAVKDYMGALNILSDERFWPSDRLPTELDRKSQWLPERDFGDDWLGIKGEGTGYKAKVHSGGDFLFCYWLIFKDFRSKPF